MRILHMISSSGFYGAERVVLDLLCLARDQAWKPYLVCLKSAEKPDPELYGRAQECDIESYVFSCGAKIDMGTVRKLNGFVRAENIECIHAHGYKADVYALMVSRSCRVPAVSTLHGWTGEDHKVGFYERIDRWIVRMFAHLVPVSPDIEETLKHAGISAEKITCIPNAVDTSRFDPSDVEPFRTEWHLDGALVFGSVGRLSPEKGHRMLIRAFSRIAAEFPRARLVITGEGPLRDNLRQLASDEKIGEKVVFSGRQTEMERVYRTMNVFILPSLTEGLPLALLEAMSMACPVIATRVGAIPGVVDPAQGMVVDPEETALTDAMRRFAADESLRIRCAAAARAKVIHEYDLASFFGKYQQVYARVCPPRTESRV
ncbi:MAG: glycosyltransferase [Candidatus Omnitrophica bacterium]|nr:glycosyltransferase [Candidatus Omnitrophota bacterium]